MKLSTFVSLAPGGSVASISRVAGDGTGAPDFASLLTLVAQDTPAGSARAGTKAMAGTTGSAIGPLAGSLAAGEGNNEDGGRQGLVPFEGEPIPGAGEPTAPVPLSKAQGLAAADPASLLTLATRAAEPVQGAAVLPTFVRASPAVPTDQPTGGIDDDIAGGTEEPANGHVAREHKEPSGDDPSVEASVPAVATVSPPAAAIAVAASILVAAMAPAVPAVAAPSSNAADRPPVVTTTPDDAASTIAEEPMRAKSQASVSMATDDIERPTPSAVPAAVANPTSVVAAIVPDSVKIESHLGFSRGLPVTEAPAQQTTAVSDVESTAAIQGDAAAPAAVAMAPSLASVPEAAGLVVDPSSSRPARRTSVQADPQSSGTTRVAPPPKPVSGRPEAVASVASHTVASAPAAIADGEISTVKPSGPEMMPNLDPVDAKQSALSTLSVSDQPVPIVADVPNITPLAVVAAVATPFQPVELAMVQQVADGVSTLALSVPADAQPVSQVLPARTMALQLSPAGLGTLTVRLHVSGRALDVQLEASDGRTAALIDRDRDALSGALRDKDYQLQSLSVTSHDATMPGGTHAERGTDTASTDAGSSSQFRGDEPSGGRSGNRESRDTQGREPQAANRRADEVAVERGSSSLFV